MFLKMSRSEMPSTAVQENVGIFQPTQVDPL